MLGRRRRQILLALFVLAAVPHPVLAGPISLDNDVDIEWSQVGGEACPIFNLCPAEVSVTGAPRLVEDAASAGDDVFFDITVISPHLFNSMFLTLQVGDTSLEELTDANGNPIVLELLLPPIGTGDFEDFFDITNNVGTLRVTLDDFTNFSLLPQGVDVIFSLSGSFSGSSFAAGGSNPTYGASIVVGGAGTPVPEPSTSILLLTAIGLGLGVRSRFGKS